MIGGEISKDLHPPRVLHLASWAIAVAMAGVFSVTVGLTVSSKLNQISAETADSTSSESTGKVTKPFYTSDGKETGESIVETCKEGALVAINNYPPSSDILKQLPVEDGIGINKTWLNKMGQLSWRCSHVCVKGFNTGDWRSADNKGNVKTALTGAKYTSDGQEQTLQVLTSEQIIELMKNGDATQMKSVVNIDSLKSRCEGPNSVDYASAGTKLNDLVILKRESTNTVATLSGGAEPANAAIGDSTNSGSVSSSATGASGTGASGNDNYQGEGGPTTVAGNAPQIVDPTSIQGYDKDSPSDVAKCWLSVANTSAEHMKNHLGVYNQTKAYQIFNDITHLLLGLIPDDDNKSLVPLHGANTANHPKVSNVYNKYYRIVKSDNKKKTQYKKNEVALLKECNAILSRIPNFSTDREDIKQLVKEKKTLLETYDKIASSRLSLIDGKVFIPKGAFGLAGDTSTNAKGFFEAIKKTSVISLEKQRYQDIAGVKNVNNDLAATRDLQKKLNEILQKNPITDQDSGAATSTITIKGNVAINNKSIKNGIINNGRGETIHICAYIIGKEKDDCHKIKTNKSDGYFEIVLKNVESGIIKDFSKSYDTNKIMIYAVVNPGKLAFIRNIYTPYPSQTVDKRVSFGPSDGNKVNQYSLKITPPIVLLGDPSVNFFNKPIYSYGKNGIKEALGKFMSDTGKDNCLFIPGNLYSDPD